MQNWMLYIAVSGMSLALIGCASEQRRFTGFLSDYANLKPHATIQDALVYWNAEIDLSKYTAMLFDPVEIHFSRARDEGRAKPENLAVFRSFIAREMTKALSKHWAIATEPGPNVFRVRLQVANVLLSRPISHQDDRLSLKHLEYVLGTANIESDAHDSMTEELIVAYVGPRITPERYTLPLLHPAPDRWEAAKAAIRARIGVWVDQAAYRAGRTDRGAGRAP